MVPTHVRRPTCSVRFVASSSKCQAFRLTLAQAQRLWGLERMVCEAALHALVRDEFLRRTRGGAFIRRAGLAA